MSRVFPKAPTPEALPACGRTALYLPSPPCHLRLPPSGASALFPSVAQNDAPPASPTGPFLVYVWTPCSCALLRNVRVSPAPHVDLRAVGLFHRLNLPNFQRENLNFPTIAVASPGPWLETGQSRAKPRAGPQKTGHPPKPNTERTGTWFIFSQHIL